MSNLSLSIVVPLYNEEQVFEKLAERLCKLHDLHDGSIEFILVDDGSHDKTGTLIKKLCKTNGAFVGISLSRNFGHQAAVSAGLSYASGNAIAVIDGDLQDPPELVIEMLNRLKEGFDVVYAVRRARKEGIMKRLSYYLFYRIMRLLCSIYIPLDSGDFCIMSKRVVLELNRMQENTRYIRGMRAYAGFRQCPYEYERVERQGGKSKYGFLRLLRLAGDGIFSFSDLPLRFASIAGFCVAIGSFLIGLLLVVWRFLTTQEIPGFATLSVGMFFLGGVQLCCIGILGEYIGRIHTEVKGRPSFIVESIFKK